MAFHRKFVIVFALMHGGRIKSYLPAIVWASLILAVSSAPDFSTPGLGFAMTDKIAHFVEYFILGFLTAKAVSTFDLKPLKIFWISSALASGYGILDEIHQFLIPGRTTEGLDMVADILGSILAVALFVRVQQKHAPKVH